MVRAVAFREARGSLPGDLPSGRASADAPRPCAIISLRGSNVKHETTRSACAVRRYSRSLGSQPQCRKGASERAYPGAGRHSKVTFKLDMPASARICVRTEEGGELYLDLALATVAGDE
jgi:hypothetical protein